MALETFQMQIFRKNFSVRAPIFQLLWLPRLNFQTQPQFKVTTPKKFHWNAEKFGKDLNYNHFDKYYCRFYFTDEGWWWAGVSEEMEIVMKTLFRAERVSISRKSWGCKNECWQLYETNKLEACTAANILNLCFAGFHVLPSKFWSETSLTVPPWNYSKSVHEANLWIGCESSRIGETNIWAASWLFNCTSMNEGLRF